MHTTTPRIVSSSEKKLIGISNTINLTNFNISELWRNFLPRINEIHNRVSNETVSMAIYSPTYFSNFNPSNEFEKWAASEVHDIVAIPSGMESFLIPKGMYAVFDYKGLPSDPGIFQYIFSKWLPTSGYKLDDRPHFEILGDRYKNNNPASEEKIYIPIIR